MFSFSFAATVASTVPVAVNCLSMTVCKDPTHDVAARTALVPDRIQSVNATAPAVMARAASVNGLVSAAPAMPRRPISPAARSPSEVNLPNDTTLPVSACPMSANAAFVLSSRDAFAARLPTAVALRPIPTAQLAARASAGASASAPVTASPR